MPVWWNAKNRVNPKLVVVSNIQNANRSARQAVLYEARSEKARQAGYFYQAKKQALLALEAYRNLFDWTATIRLNLFLGDVSRQCEQFTEAKLFYQRARLICQQHSEDSQPFDALDASVGVALSLRGEGQYPASIQELKKTFVAYKKSKDREGMAFVLWAMGTTYRFMGHLRLAEKTLRSSIVLYRSLNDASGLAYAQAGLGGTLRMRGCPIESEGLYKSANRFFQKHRDEFGMAYTFCGIGNARRMQGDYVDGLKYSEQAAVLYRRLKMKGPLGFVLWTQAQIHVFLGNLRSAKSCLLKTEKLFTSVKDKRGLVYANLGWGSYFSQKKQPSLAEKYFRRAAIAALKSQLMLELAHAWRGKIGSTGENKKVWALYKKCGVELKRFKQYETLP